MTKMTIDLLGLTSNQMENLKSEIASKNSRGIIVKLERRKPQENTLDGGDYLPIIQLILGSTVVNSTVRGIFDILKAHLNARLTREKMRTKAEIERVESSLLEFSVKKGKKQYSLKLYSLNDEEREKFYVLVDHILK